MSLLSDNRPYNQSGGRMNDRFRFRHWDKRISKMLYPKKNDNFEYYVNNSDIIETMQCTRLKDKNGKLIYEGDILGGIYHGYIEYCNECKCFQLKVKDYGCLACGGDLHWYELVEAEEQNELEVIGNIYENKELLESEG